MTTDDDRPISRLDEYLDDLIRGLGQLPNLEAMVAGMRAHEEVASHLGPDFPGVVGVLAGAEFRRALINVAGEVLALRSGGTGHGGS